MTDWPELDTLVEELRAQNEERWRQTQELHEQLSQIQAQLEVVGRQYDELQVRELLQEINERLLGGLGTLESMHGGKGLEFVAALVWPLHCDPRSIPAELGDGVYRINVWLGLHLQDGKPRIRISGARRLQATLPTSVDRFRAALLTVFRDPEFLANPQAAEHAEDDQVGGETDVSAQAVGVGSASRESEAAARDDSAGPAPAASPDRSAEPGPQAPADVGAPKSTGRRNSEQNRVAASDAPSVEDRHEAGATGSDDAIPMGPAGEK